MRFQEWLDNAITYVVKRVNYYKHLPSYIRFKLNQGINYNEYVKGKILVENSLKVLRKQIESDNYRPCEDENLYAGQVDMKEAPAYSEYVKNKDKGE